MTKNQITPAQRLHSDLGGFLSGLLIGSVALLVLIVFDADLNTSTQWSITGAAVLTFIAYFAYVLHCTRKAAQVN